MDFSLSLCVSLSMQCLLKQRKCQSLKPCKRMLNGNIRASNRKNERVNKRNNNNSNNDFPIRVNLRRFYIHICNPIKKDQQHSLNAQCYF